MKKLKLMLDYNCFPIWLYDEEDDLIDNDLPEELKEDKELDARLVRLQSEYDELFMNTDTEFKYKGFKSGRDKRHFLKEFAAIQDDMDAKLNGKYEVLNLITL